jgi:hypothetical protein
VKTNSMSLLRLLEMFWLTHRETGVQGGWRNLTALVLCRQLYIIILLVIISDYEADNFFPIIM